MKNSKDTYLITLHVNPMEGRNNDKILSNIAELLTENGYYCFGEVAITRDIHKEDGKIDFSRSYKQHASKIKW